MNYEQRIKKLEEEVKSMKDGHNIRVADGMERLLAKAFLNVRNRSDVTNSDVDVTATIGVGGGTVNMLDFPDRWIYVLIDGKLHRIGAWLEENDASRSYGS